MQKHTEYKLPASRFSNKEFDRLTYYFLIREATEKNKKSVIQIGVSKGTEAGFSFNILRNVKSNYTDTRDFINNRMRAGYKIIDSEKVELSRDEFFSFVSNSRYHTKGSYNPELKDGNGYSFTIKPEKKTPNNYDRGK